MLTVNSFTYKDIQPEGWVQEQYQAWLDEYHKEYGEAPGSYTADWAWDKFNKESQEWKPCQPDDINQAIKDIIFNLDCGCWWKKSEYAITLYANDWGPYREILPVLRVKFDNAEKTAADTEVSTEQAQALMEAIEKAIAEIEAKEAAKGNEIIEEPMTDENEPLEEAMDEY